MQLNGEFNENGDPVVKLRLDQLTLEVVVDTGFNGFLFVPNRVANQLRLETSGEGLTTTYYSVTGEEILADVYWVEIDWLGMRRRIPIETSSQVDQSLLGGRLLDNCRLIVDYRRRIVTISET